MAYECKILADSINPVGVRLTTMQVTFPRIVLAEFNTHRMFSRNSASSRAIPVEKMIERVEKDPFIPESWGRNCKGMSAREELDEEAASWCSRQWRDALNLAVDKAHALSRSGAHKQLANRLLEPFMWQTVIVTATDWDNFFKLRCAPDAQPEIRKIACMMRDALVNSGYLRLLEGQWHLPLTDDLDQEWLEYEKRDVEDLAKISAARCARVSYLTHDGKLDIDADLKLAKKLLDSGHMSPFEHAAQAEPHFNYIANFCGWKQYRKMVE